MSTQTYISLPMRRRRVRKKHREAVADREAVVYHDRSSWALDAQLASRASAGDDAVAIPLEAASAQFDRQDLALAQDLPIPSDEDLGLIFRQDTA